MWIDPIVQEIHAIRKNLLDQVGGDLHQAIVMAHRARNPNRKVFRGQARRPLGWKEEPVHETGSAMADDGNLASIWLHHVCRPPAPATDAVLPAVQSSQLPNQG